MDKQQKTVTIAIADFRETIIQAINESGLPAAVIEPILGNIYQQVAALAAAQLKEDRGKAENKQ